MAGDFLFHKVDEKERAEIKKQAKKIMDSFSKKLSKVGKVSESLIEREQGEREEEKGKVSAPLGVPQSTECWGKIDRKIMFDNAPEKNGDFIVAEKGGWK